MRSYLTVVYLLILFVFVGHGAADELNRPPWSEKFYQYVAQEYGVDAEKRLHFLEKFILDNQDSPVMDQVILVNRTMNQLPWIADSEHRHTSRQQASRECSASSAGHLPRRATKRRKGSPAGESRRSK